MSLTLPAGHNQVIPDLVLPAHDLDSVVTPPSCHGAIHVLAMTRGDPIGACGLCAAQYNVTVHTMLCDWPVVLQTKQSLAIVS